tara:strand:+ start:5605 stop:6489 length:885 start_codon:yes stop_codon:yes gene_type:complete
MKKTSILLMALLLSPQLQAQGGYGGVEGGNGGNYTLHASCHSYRDCYQSVERILLLKQREALNHREVGNIPAARTALKNGLKEAVMLLRNEASYKPLTLTALQRGLNYNDAFKNGCQQTSEANCLIRQDEVATVFLAVYYQHITERIIPLDLDYYIPYRRNRCHYYGNRNWWRAFVTDYRIAAAELLDLVTGKSINRDFPMSLYKDIYEVQVQIQTLGYVAEDLKNDDFRRYFYHPVADLLGERDYLIQTLNQNPHPRILSRAVRNARYTISDVSDWLNGFNYEYKVPRYRCGR